MKVYFAPNTRAIRTVWLLNELGIEHEIVQFKLGDKAMRDPEYLKVNPNGRVPTLVDGDTVVTESTAIAQYLVARYGNGKLVPPVESPEFPVYLQWLHYAEGMMMPPVNTIVVETILLPPERRNEDNANRARKLLARTIGPVDQHLAGREYLAREFSAADTITGHACIVAERLLGDISEHANLKAYIERLKARPALQSVLALS